MDAVRNTEVRWHQQSPRARHDSDPPSPRSKPATPGFAPSEHKSNDSRSAPSDTTHDSMVSVPLSGPPSLSIDTNHFASHLKKPSSSLARTVETAKPGAEARDEAKDVRNRILGLGAGKGPGGNNNSAPKKGARPLENKLQDSARDDAPDRSSEDSVNWEQLQRTEHEHKERESDTVSRLLPVAGDRHNELYH